MRLWRIQNWTNHPVVSQREVLQDLVTTAQYTVFGKKYNFSKLFTVKQFKQRIPIHEYQDLQPYILRMMEGEENVLWNTPIKWFAKSSGTTSDKSKFIPVSDESLQDNHFQASKDLLTNYYKNFPSSDLLTGKSLVVGGSHQLSQLNDEIQYGDLSAVFRLRHRGRGHLQRSFGQAWLIDTDVLTDNRIWQARKLLSVKYELHRYLMRRSDPEPSAHCTILVHLLRQNAALDWLGNFRGYQSRLIDI